MIIPPEAPIKVYPRVRFIYIFQYLYLVIAILGLNFVYLLFAEKILGTDLALNVALILFPLSLLLLLWKLFTTIAYIFLPSIFIDENKFIFRKSIISYHRFKTKDISLVSAEMKKFRVIHKIWVILEQVLLIWILILLLVLASSRNGYSVGHAGRKLGSQILNLIKIKHLPYLKIHSKNRVIFINSNTLNLNYQELFELNEAHQD